MSAHTNLLFILISRNESYFNEQETQGGVIKYNYLHFKYKYHVLPDQYQADS